jgi:hypothetical protein
MKECQTLEVLSKRLPAGQYDDHLKDCVCAELFSPSQHVRPHLHCLLGVELPSLQEPASRVHSDWRVSDPGISQAIQIVEDKNKG